MFFKMLMIQMYEKKRSKFRKYRGTIKQKLWNILNVHLPVFVFDNSVGPNKVLSHTRLARGITHFSFIYPLIMATL